MARWDELGYLELDEKDYALLSRRREESLKNRNGDEYRLFTDFYGFHPEDSILYGGAEEHPDPESSIARILGLPPRPSSFKSTLPSDLRERYRRFYDRARNLSDNSFNDTQEKIKLLQTEFPAKFGEGGKQPLNVNSSPQQVGFIFRQLLISARKNLEE